MTKKRKIANNCEKATFLIEKKQFGKITLRDRLELQIHLAGCQVCRTYQKQSKLITKVSQQVFNEQLNYRSTLDENSKIHMQQLIEKAINK
ncbi:hypothetical protein BH11BAC4_BH11BAC4_21910 [soil metagenome]